MSQRSISDMKCKKFIFMYLIKSLHSSLYIEARLNIRSKTFSPKQSNLLDVIFAFHRRLAQKPWDFSEHFVKTVLKGPVCITVFQVTYFTLSHELNITSHPHN